MEFSGRSLTSDRLTFFILVFCIIFVACQVFLLLASLGNLPPEVPIFYSRPWGDKILGPPYMLWILPIIAAFSVIINYFISSYIVKKIAFLVRTLFVFSLLVSIISLYDVVKIITLLV